MVGIPSALRIVEQRSNRMEVLNLLFCYFKFEEKDYGE